MVTEILDGVLAVFGPFVIPVALFVGGLIGYLVLVAISRAWTE